MGRFRMPRQIGVLLAILVATIILNSSRVSAQVTFSRDWNAGKRADPMLECKGTAKTAATVCHMLLDELRQLVSCESRSLMRLLQTDDLENNPGPIFNGGR